MKPRTRLKKWPHWHTDNAALFIASLALYVALFGLLCSACSNARVVFVIVSTVAALSTFALLWVVLNQKDKNEE